MVEKTNRIKPQRIYVAHRYSVPADVISILKNIGVAIEAGIKIIEKGHYPYIPHLDCLIAIWSKGKIPKRFFYFYGLAWVEASDAILILDRRDLKLSEGVQLAHRHAQQLGKTIYYSLQEIPKVKKEWE